MKLEDALICLVLKAGDIPDDKSAGAYCEQAAAGGLDMLVCDADAGWLTEVHAICKREEVLFVVAEYSGDQVIEDVDGYHYNVNSSGFAQARTLVGPGKLLGVSSATQNEAVLAAEIDPDYIVHDTPGDCLAETSAIRADSRISTFCTVSTPEEGARMLSSGFVRFALHSRSLDAGRITDEVSAYSRLLGRCI